MGKNRSPAPRFGIGEWYGKSFARIPRQEMVRLARVALGKDARSMVCPFRGPERDELCTKRGGVCSLRLYRSIGRGLGGIVEGEDGALRATCPYRFQQAGQLYEAVGRSLLETPHPKVVTEVRFLQRMQSTRDDSLPSEETTDAHKATLREGVGNIDVILVHPTASPMKWCALEVQAVYFSGPAMASLFRQIQDMDRAGIPFPASTRRPDYRSSAPKRLMPQLQIKVPTLRRWGKKMAVAVDRGFFRNLGFMRTVADISNADIAWFVADFEESVDRIMIRFGAPEKQKLEDAVEGLTGGEPVTLEEFEQKIAEKLREMDLDAPRQQSTPGPT